jgi:D-alanyl-lipoteichoic acid acyltransferase DltB (MBOAT superfamily)
MTLSRFLRDYLYIPLGGNRHGLRTQLFALLTTMALGGLWHGAGMNFVLWGALHGAGLCVALLWSRSAMPLSPMLGWALTFTFVVFTWVPFRAVDFDSAVLMWRGLLGLQLFPHRFTDPEHWKVIAVGLAFALVGPTAWQLSERISVSFTTSLAAGTLGALVLLRLTSGGSQQFIYFQF